MTGYVPANAAAVYVHVWGTNIGVWTEFYLKKYGVADPNSGAFYQHSPGSHKWFIVGLSDLKFEYKTSTEGNLYMNVCGYFTDDEVVMYDEPRYITPYIPENGTGIITCNGGTNAKAVITYARGNDQHSFNVYRADNTGQVGTAPFGMAHDVVKCNASGQYRAGRFWIIYAYEIGYFKTGVWLDYNLDIYQGRQNFLWVESKHIAENARWIWGHHALDSIYTDGTFGIRAKGSSEDLYYKSNQGTCFIAEAGDSSYQGVGWYTPNAAANAEMKTKIFQAGYNTDAAECYQIYWFNDATEAAAYSATWSDEACADEAGAYQGTNFGWTKVVAHTGGSHTHTQPGIDQTFTGRIIFAYPRGSGTVTNERRRVIEYRKSDHSGHANTGEPNFGVQGYWLDLSLEVDAPSSFTIDDTPTVIGIEQIDFADSFSIDDTITCSRETTKTINESLDVTDRDKAKVNKPPNIHWEQWEFGQQESFAIDDVFSCDQTLYNIDVAESFEVDSAPPGGMFDLSEILPDSSFGIDDAQTVGMQYLLELWKSEDGMFFHIHDEWLSGYEYTLPALSDSFGIDDTWTVGYEYERVVTDSFGIDDATAAVQGLKGSINVTLPSLRIAAYGFYRLIATLPALRMSATGKFWTTGRISATLPMLSTSMTGTTNRAGTISVSLPSLRGSLSGTTLLHGNMAKTLPMISTLILGSTGGISTVSVRLPMLTISSTGHVSIIGTINVTLPPLGTAQVERIWEGAVDALCLNIKNHGLTRYEDYPYYGMCSFNGKHIGCYTDGIYEIGNRHLDDNGSDIELRIRTGFLDLEAKNVLQKARHAILTYKSNGDIVLTVVLNDDTEYEYEVENFSHDNVERRVKFGKGLDRRYIAFDLKNVAGSSFELDMLRVMAEPVRHKKR